MRRHFYLILFLASSLFAEELDFSKEASAATNVRVVVEGAYTDGGVRCTLARAVDGEKPQVLWKLSEAESNGPLDWFNLLSADENHGELGVLVESGKPEIRMLRLKLPSGQVIGDVRLLVPGLLLRLNHEGGILQVKVPDRIEWTNGAGRTRKFVLKGDQLVGDGDVGFDPSSANGGYSDDQTDQSTRPSAKTGSGATSEGSGMASDAGTGDKQNGTEPNQVQDTVPKGWALGIAGVILLVLAFLAVARKRRSL